MSKRLGTDKDIQDMARAAERQGFEVIITGNNHLKWIPPRNDNKGERRTPLITPLTFGDRRRIQKVRKFLRDHGIDV